MLDEKTQQKYLKILKNEKTLKLDASDAIELLKAHEELQLDDQSGGSILESSISKCKGKVILHFFTLWHNENKRVLYWSPCSLSDIVTVAGAGKFDAEADRYQESEWIPRNKQVSFLGGDIKKACNNYETTRYLETFVNKYIKNGHPIADNIFYTVYLKNKDAEQEFNCSRNTVLSPRPEKKIEEAK